MSEKQTSPKESKILGNPAELSGFTARKTPPCEVPGATSGRPLSLAWITDDLLAYTQEVWSRAYGRHVSEDEAIEMLLNVKRLAEVMFKVAATK